MSAGLAFAAGDRYPAWKGNMLISALIGRMVLRVVLDGDRVVHEEPLLEGLGRMRNVQLAPDGLIYVANETTGEILRIIPADLIGRN